MDRVDFKNVKITGGFWKEKQDLIRNTTVYAVYDRFNETGRFEALKCDPNAEKKAHIFWDSDVAKWIEGVAYLLSEKRDAHLENLVDEMVSNIIKNQDENGYFNSYYLVNNKEKPFTVRDNHELYCLGHLIEAGIAYYEATGKRELLDAMCKYVHYVKKRFVIDKDTGFETPGHEEIELALVRLYDLTGDKEYLELASFFVERRGNKEPLNEWARTMYNQSHLPPREQLTAEGHSVRATYFYCAMADLALKYSDTGLKNACERIFDDIVNYKMYITGGIGSSSAGEAFTIPYDLPDVFAYTESCAAIGLILFAQRMLLLTNDAKYSHVIERTLYNGFLSSTSLNGKAFFYCNPLRIAPYMNKRDVSADWKSFQLPVTVRQEVFECSCCPPNIVRFIPSLGNLLYTTSENAIYLHQFMQSKASIKQGNSTFEIEQKTAYPENGRVQISIKGGNTKLYVRIPEFVAYEGKMENGYAVFEVTGERAIELDLDLSPRFIMANPKIHTYIGRCAVAKGPVIYCLEGKDNEVDIESIYLDTNSEIKEGINKELGIPTLTINAFYEPEMTTLYAPLSRELKPTKATLIPYYAFANRGESPMQVWSLFKQ